MRHRVDHRKLNRSGSHRKAMYRSMVTSLFDNDRIMTTDAKAKEARRLAERLITRARKGYTAHREGLSLKEAGKTDEAKQKEAVALAHWRQAGRFVRKTSVLRKLFDVIAPHFLERPGGYTRIIKIDRRLGDNATTVLLELVDTEKTKRPVIKKSAEGKAEAPPAEAKEKEEEGEEKKGKAKPKTKAKAKGKSKEKAEPAPAERKPEKPARKESAKPAKKKTTIIRRKTSQD
jgi:large subunit ribosomal protein L17